MEKLSSLFAPLAMKVMAGIIVALLLANAVTGYLLDNAYETIEAKRNELATCEAQRELQNAAVEEMKREGQRRAQAAQDALQRAKAQSKASEGLAKRIEAPRALSGECKTPQAIMEAGL